MQKFECREVWNQLNGKSSRSLPQPWENFHGQWVLLRVGAWLTTRIFSSERLFVWVLHFCFLVLCNFVFYEYCKTKQWYRADSYDRLAPRARNAGQEIAPGPEQHLALPAWLARHSRVTRAFAQSLASTKVLLKVVLLLIYLFFLKKKFLRGRRHLSFL